MQETFRGSKYSMPDRFARPAATLVATQLLEETVCFTPKPDSAPPPSARSVLWRSSYLMSRTLAVLASPCPILTASRALQAVDAEDGMPGGASKAEVAKRNGQVAKLVRRCAGMRGFGEDVDAVEDERAFCRRTKKGPFEVSRERLLLRPPLASRREGDRDRRNGFILPCERTKGAQCVHRKHVRAQAHPGSHARCRRAFKVRYNLSRSGKSVRREPAYRILKILRRHRALNCLEREMRAVRMLSHCCPAP